MTLLGHIVSSHLFLVLSLFILVVPFLNNWGTFVGIRRRWDGKLDFGVDYEIRGGYSQLEHRVQYLMFLFEFGWGRHRGRCRRNRHSDILCLSPVPEHSGTGLGLLIPVPNWFRHRRFLFIPVPE